MIDPIKNKYKIATSVYHALTVKTNPKERDSKKLRIQFTHVDFFLFILRSTRRRNKFSLN